MELIFSKIHHNFHFLALFHLVLQFKHSTVFSGDGVFQWEQDLMTVCVESCSGGEVNGCVVTITQQTLCFLSQTMQSCAGPRQNYSSCPLSTGGKGQGQEAVNAGTQLAMLKYKCGLQITTSTHGSYLGRYAPREYARLRPPRGALVWHSVSSPLD